MRSDGVVAYLFEVVHHGLAASGNSPLGLDHVKNLLSQIHDHREKQGPPVDVFKMLEATNPSGSPPVETSEECRAACVLGGGKVAGREGELAADTNFPRRTNPVGEMTKI